MAKKKTPPLEGIGRDPENKLIVQKTKPLFELWRSNLTLAEFKIMDMYLARIDTRKPEKRTVKLTKGQLEEALGVTRINRPDLEQRLKNLYQPIDLAKGDRKRLHLVSLFEEAEADQDEDGVWQITLTCTNAAMKYIFKAEELGYLRYKLRSITSLTSRYTYVLFTYLEANRFRKTWDIPLEELKKILNCEADASYSEFKIFNQRILKKSQKELHEKTDCRFTYEPIRKGRSVASIRFTVETLSDEMLGIEADPNQFTVEEYLAMISGEDQPRATPMDELLDLLSSVCDNEFSREDVVMLHDAMNELNIFPLSFDSSIDRADFLRQKYNAMVAEDVKKKSKGQKPIANRRNYLLSLIRKGK